MRHIDWKNVQESGDFERPVPGGYVAVICGVNDKEDKEYLEIFWDFTEPPYKGANRSTYDHSQFWPTKLFRSYKEKALGMFKAFYLAVEDSNPGYHFDDQNVKGLVGKRVGVVLGEEEYPKNNGDIGTRLYVCQTKRVQAIEDGDFKVPELKRMDRSAGKSNPSRYSSPTPRAGNFAEVTEEDGDLPF